MARTFEVLTTSGVTGGCAGDDAQVVMGKPAGEGWENTAGLLPIGPMFEEDTTSPCHPQLRPAGVRASCVLTAHSALLVLWSDINR